MNISSLNSVFFIGIGGIGMSGLAKYFLDKGVKVYGYDKDSSFIRSMESCVHNARLIRVWDLSRC